MLRAKVLSLKATGITEVTEFVEARAIAPTQTDRIVASKNASILG